MIKRIRQYRLPSFDEVMDEKPKSKLPSFDEVMGATEKKSKVGGDVPTTGSGVTTTSTSSGEFPLLYNRKVKTESLPAVLPTRIKQEKPKTNKEVQEFIQTEYKPIITNPTDKDIETNLADDINKTIESHSGDDPLRAILDTEQKIKYTLPDGTPDFRANAKAFTKKIEILNNAFHSGEQAKSFLEQGLFNEDISNLSPEQIKEIAGNNLTKQIAANRYEKLRDVQEVLHNRTLDEASIYYAAKSDPNIKNLLELAGGPGGDTKETSAIPLAMRGQKKLEFLMNPDVRQIAMQDPDRKREYDNEIANFASHHPEFATRLLADAIAKRREETGGNNWFANVVGKEATDKIVDDLIADGQFPPGYKLLYQKTIRPKLGTWQSIGRGVGNAIPGLNQAINEAPIPTPGLLENFEQGFENFQVGTAKTLASVPLPGSSQSIMSQMQPEGQQVFNTLEKQYSTPILEPKGLLHKSSLHGGNLMGFVAGLAGTTGALNATKLLNPQVAQATSMVLATHGDSNERAKVLFPGEKLKQGVYVGVMDILNGVMGKYLPGQQIPRLLKPSENIIASTLTKMVDGKITTDAAKGVLTNLVANTVKGSLKGGEFMGAIAGVDDLLTQTLQGKGIDFSQSTEKAWDAFKIGLLATGPLSLMEAGLKSNKPFRNEILSMADNPDYYKELANREAETNPEFSKIKDEVIQNIDYVSGVKREVAGLKPKEQSNYVITSLAEKVKLNQAEKATDPTIKKRFQEEAKRLNEIKEGLLNGVPEEKVKEIHAIKEVKDFYNDGFLPKSANGLLETKKTEESDGKFDEAKVKSFLEAVAQETGKKYPSRIRELADEMFPQYKEERESKEISEPIELSPELPEGYQLPEKPIAEVNIPEVKSHVPEVELPPLPEDYNIVDPPSAKPTETVVPASGEEPTTSIKNKQTLQERQERGLGEVEVLARRSFPEVFDKGKEMVDKGEIDPRLLAKEMSEKPRPLKAEESVALLYDRMKLQNEYKDTVDQIIKYSAEGEEVRATILRDHLKVLEELRNTNDEAARRTGYEQGLGLSIRKLMIKEDYSLLNKLQEFKAANGGKELPEEIRAKLEKMTTDLEEANKKLEEYEQKISDLEAQKNIDKEKRKRPEKKTDEDFKSERKDILGKLKKKWDDASKGKEGLTAVPLPYLPQLIAIAPEMGKLIKSYAEQGIIKLEDIVKDIHANFTSNIDKRITEQDIRDLLGGKYNQPKGKPILDRKKMMLQANIEKIKKQIDGEKERVRLQNRSKWERYADNFHKWRRFALLSGVKVLGKIGVAAAARSGVVSPLESGITEMLKIIPGVSKISEGAPREGAGFNPKAEAKALAQWFDKMTYKDIGEVLKTGEGELDYLYKKKNYPPEGWLGFFGKLHAAIKTLPKRAEFFRSFELRAEHAAKNGKDLTDPLVQQEIAVAAYNDGMRTIFMNDNYITDSYKSIIRSLENSKEGAGGGKVAANLMKFLFPIIKVPTNYVAEATSYMIGGLKAAVALRKGIAKLTPDEKDYIMRNFKKQTIGVAIIMLGYFNPGAVGGYYSGKRDDDDLAAGDLTLFGVHLPHWMSHTPLLEALQLGATLRRAKDDASAKGEKANVFTGLPIALRGIKNQIPFFGQGEQVSRAMGGMSSFEDYIFRMGQGVIEPQLLKEVAEWTDTDPEGKTVKRKPEDFLETLKMGIPKLRQQVSEKTPSNSSGKSNKSRKPTKAN